jgi:hypothetical protein
MAARLRYHDGLVLFHMGEFGTILVISVPCRTTKVLRVSRAFAGTGEVARGGIKNERARTEILD